MKEFVMLNSLMLAVMVWTDTWCGRILLCICVLFDQARTLAQALDRNCRMRALWAISVTWRGVVGQNLWWKDIPYKPGWDVSFGLSMQSSNSK